MQVAFDLAVVVLLPAQGRNGADPDADAPDRRAVPGNAVLRGAADDLAFAQRGHLVNDKRIRRLMRLIGLMPIYQKPNTSKAAKGQKTDSLLLQGLRVI